MMKLLSFILEKFLKKNVHKIIISTEHLQKKYKIRYLFVGTMSDSFRIKYDDLLKRNSDFLFHINGVKIQN